MKLEKEDLEKFIKELRKTTPVAVKKLSLLEKDVEENLKTLLNEIRIWK